MNRYLMKVYHFFSGYEPFEIDAESKEDAINKGKEYVRNNSLYTHGGNYKLDDVICVKKIKVKKRKGENNNA